MPLNDLENKLYTQESDGSYTVNFPNKHALTNQEIKDRFSPFGKVLSIRCAGDDRGFRFVRLGSYEEVVAAIVGFRNDPSVQLKERRVKNKSNGFENRNGNGSFENRNGRHQNEGGQNRNWRTRSENGDDRKSEKDENDRVSISPHMTTRGSSTISARLIQVRSPAVSVNGEEPKMTLEKVNDVRNKVSEAFSDKESRNGDENVEGPNKMPPLVIAKNNSAQVVMAQEVVVANIHDNYGCAFILHLLEKFNPLAITEMSYVKHSKLRYCHVFFRSEVEANNAIQGYDDFNLMGKKLIMFKPVA